jgi:hypothetical protein
MSGKFKATTVVDGLYAIADAINNVASKLSTDTVSPDAETAQSTLNTNDILGRSKPKRYRRTKAQMAAARETENRAAAADVSPALDTDAGLTQETLPADYLLDNEEGLREIGRLLQKRGETTWVIEQLKKYDCAQFPKVPVERRDELLAIMKAKLAELKKSD